MFAEIVKLQMFCLYCEKMIQKCNCWNHEKINDAIISNLNPAGKQAACYEEWYKQNNIEITRDILVKMYGQTNVEKMETAEAAAQVELAATSDGKSKIMSKFFWSKK